MAAKQPAKKASSGGNSKNLIVAGIAVVALIGAGLGLFMYFRPAPVPAPDTNVLTGATAEEIKAHEAQKETQLRLEKKIKPAGA